MSDARPDPGAPLSPEPARVVRVFPRRKLGEAVRRADHPVLVTLEMIRHFQTMSLKDASKELNLSTTALKGVCRRLGITSWPFKTAKDTRNVKRIARASIKTEKANDSDTTAPKTPRSAVATPPPMPTLTHRRHPKCSDAPPSSVAAPPPQTPPRLHSTDAPPASYLPAGGRGYLDVSQAAACNAFYTAHFGSGAVGGAHALHPLLPQTSEMSGNPAVTPPSPRPWAPSARDTSALGAHYRLPPAVINVKDEPAHGSGAAGRAPVGSRHLHEILAARPLLLPRLFAIVDAACGDATSQNWSASEGVFAENFAEEAARAAETLEPLTGDTLEPLAGESALSPVPTPEELGI
ncbi:hypothetical protein T484DRAFT_1859966 [Baffinella frigidus]|nr:hypothetical protein T484DRAFT_1859966 [Cryptophyta sp. CCMP2293]